MIPTSQPPVDPRDVNALLAEFENRLHGYIPQWNPPAKSAGAAIAPIFARMIAAVLQRLNQAPGKNKLALLDLLGLRLVPAQPARAPIVFSLSKGSSDTIAPEGTQIAAPPPVGSTQQIVFSTEQDAAVAAATLSEVVSLWPGRDEYVDHSAAIASAQPFTLFQNLQLKHTEHILYLAHSKFLALAGTAMLKVIFDLAQEGSSPLMIAWEYWDGEVWRGFFASSDNPVQNPADGTNGLSVSGSVQLKAQGGQTAQVAVNGATSYWIRARVTQPLLPDANRILPEVETIRLVTVVQQDFEAILTSNFNAPTSSKIFVQDGSGDPMAGDTVKMNINGATTETPPLFDGTADATGLVVIQQAFVVGTGYTIKIGASTSTENFFAKTPYANLIVTDPVTSVVDLCIVVVLTNGAGSGLPGGAITIADTTDPSQPSIFGESDVNGNLLLGSPSFIAGHTYSFSVVWSGYQAFSSAVYSGTPVYEIYLSLALQALRVDKAFADGKTLDVTKAFLPFGPLPQAGSAFYFKQTEAFSKPGAMVKIFANAISPASPPPAASPLTHLIVWEYWNGFDWIALLDASAGADFTAPQIVQFVVPNDMRTTTVNNENGMWVRVRVAGGKYGYVQTLTLPPGSVPQVVSFPVNQTPVLADFRVSYSWQNGPFPLEQVLTCNDFQFVDYTDSARYPGSPFAPYQLLGDVTPTLYLGFSQQLPVDNYGLYLDIAEQAGVTAGPAMVWEYWNGGQWATVSAEDQTAQLALAGMATFIPAADAQPLARFNSPLFWLRGRLKADGPPLQTVINKIYTNAVWASQWQVFTNSPLGASTGVPRQIFRFNQVPVLPGQQIEIQELAGPRANTEWRSIAIQVVPDDPNIVTKLEALLAAEGPQTDILVGDVHLVRDKTKKVIAVWIQWKERENFFTSGPIDRVYVLDHALGRLFFGDGDSGMIPPSGALIQASSFRSGGGLAGNVPAGSVKQLLGSVPGVAGVTNPRAAEGGADGETLKQFEMRAPSGLRNRGRAIVPADYEAMAQQASAGVAVARAFPELDTSGIARPGWITVMIIPQSNDPQPVPSAGLRQEVRDYLMARAPADLAGAGAINVVGPTYIPVDVSATIAPVDPAKAGTVEQDVLDALAAFLNPLTGGPGGQGWDVGRGLFASDIAKVLGDLTGVDYVQDLGLYVNGVLQGDQVQVPLRQIVVAGQLKISIVLPARS